MKCAEYDINLAEGVRLPSDIRLGAKLYPAGHALTAEDIIIFKMHGLRRITGIMPEESDISSRTALGIIAAKICGEGMAYTVDASGLCHIAAAADGVFINNQARTSKFNRLHSNLILNTAEPYTTLKKGQVAAELELTVPFCAQNEIDDVIFKLSGNTALLSLKEYRPQKAALVYAKLLDDEAENRNFTAAVTRLVQNFAPLNVDFAHEYTSAYNVNAAADALQDALKADNEVIFILGALPSSCREDVLPAAMCQLADDVVMCRIPQVGVSDLFISSYRGKKIILLPFRYALADTALIDRYIKQALFSEKILAADFTQDIHVVLPGAEILDEDLQASLIMPQNTEASPQGNIAAVVLAAGMGSRSGRNKLMVELENGSPLFMNAVNAAIGSQASPVFVVTGYHDEEMRDHLDKADVNVLYNPSYRSGVKTSLELGLKSVPAFCKGAVIIPADMPNLTAADINKLIAAFNPEEEKQLCFFSCGKESKSNPVLWSASLFDRADLVPENSAQRAVFAEHADYTTIVKIRDCNKLLDVNYPIDIETAGGRTAKTEI